MTTTKLGIDLDGVLFDFVSKYVEIIREADPKALPTDYQHNTWNAPISLELEDKIWDKIRDTEDFWLLLRPFDANVKTLQSYSYSVDKFGIYYVTSRARTKGMNLLSQCHEILRAHYLLGYNTSIIPVQHPSDKKKIYAAIGVDYSIDDKAETVHMLRGLKDHKAFVLDQPWNRDWHDLDDIRVKSMREFILKINEDKEDKCQSDGAFSI